MRRSTVVRVGPEPPRVTQLHSLSLPSAPSLSESRLRAPVIKHGNAGNQTKDPASATISKESGGLPHGKPRKGQT